MEKKTIGRFIAALRKANGMTQKELGEKLFVSDKTVSRWERDECTPELSLIPSIAEMFGITTDELLRGERNNPDNEKSWESIEWQKSKSDKQFKLMIHEKQKRYKNLTLISFGITVFGFIVAIIADLAFSEGLIAFCIAVAFFVASEICQLCFTISARILVDEDDDIIYTDKSRAANSEAVKTAVAVSFVNLCSVAFCLPLVVLIDGANFGLSFDSWLIHGFGFSLAILAVAYIIYILFVRKQLCYSGLIVMNADEKYKADKNSRLLKRMVAVSLSIALLIGILIILINNFGNVIFTPKLEFDNCVDFKSFMESDYDKWLEEGYRYYDADGNLIIEIPINPDMDDLYGDSDGIYYPDQEIGVIKNSAGDVICEYYYNPNLYKDIIFNDISSDRMPVTVITSQAHYDSVNWEHDIESVLYFLLVADFVATACVYLIKLRKNKIQDRR